MKSPRCVGIDTSPIRAARTGIRGSNDIVWVGRAANHAAKLTEMRGNYQTWISKDAYDKAMDDVKINGPARTPMWTPHKWTGMNDAVIYASEWRWKI